VVRAPGLVRAAAGTCAARGKLADETVDDTESFLPSSAESTEVVRLLDQEFESGQTSNGLIVYERPGGLTPADAARARRDARRVARAIPVTERPEGPVVSRSGDVALVTLTVPEDYDKLADWGKEVKDRVGERHGGLRVYLTGDLGFNTDAEEIFGSIDTKLLLATALLVLILLGAIYRSPVIAVVPLLVVGFSYAVAQGLIYLYAKSGAEVSSNATSILVVLMFGVGTDYCLLLVSRYREELRRQEDKHAAMARAVRRAGRRSWPAGSPSAWRCWCCWWPRQAPCTRSARSPRSAWRWRSRPA
jgi:putative drug exporter of the RND superfamily